MPKFWGGSKAILRGKFIVIGAYIKKKVLKWLNFIPQVSRKWMKPKVSRKKEIARSD